MAKGIRPWCAQIRFPGLQPCFAGNITMPADAQSHEIEAALIAHFLTFLPPGFVIIEQKCGAIFFQEYNNG